MIEAQDTRLRHLSEYQERNAGIFRWKHHRVNASPELVVRMDPLMPYRESSEPKESVSAPR